MSGKVVQINKVKKTAEVGDWVITEGYSENYDGRPLKITRKKPNLGDVFYYFEHPISEGDNFAEGRIKRHATPEEITEAEKYHLWTERGRKPWELRVNDLLINRKGEIHRVTKATDGIHIEFEHIPLHAIKEIYKVACFAEDRKDIEQ